MGQKLSDLKSLFGSMGVTEVTGSPDGEGHPSDGGDATEDLYSRGAAQPEPQTQPVKLSGEGANANAVGDGETVVKCTKNCTQTDNDGADSLCSCPNMSWNDDSECSGRNSVPTLSLQRTGEASTSCRRTARTLSLGRRSRVKVRVPKETASKKKRNPWVLKFNCRLKGMKSPDIDIPEPNVGCDSCVCTGYRRTEEHHLGAGVVFEAATPMQQRTTPCHSDSSSSEDSTPNQMNPVIDLSKFNPEDYPIEDCDERARQERAREIAEGVDPPPGFQPQIQLVYPPEFTINDLTALFQTHLGIHPALTALTQLDMSLSAMQRMVHTQVDYIHCLVPDLLQITSCSFYWGKMDRYEAERLLEGRTEGTFLLRDSAQEEYLFSVSFRKYGRSLHARIEQWNHKFSFDSHDPGVFASPTVCGLIEHYKDPSCCMFFEPMLTIPLHRNFAFPLQHLCRAVICSNITYDGINQLCLPKSLKGYLKEYHYKQRVRVRRFDSDH